MTDERDQNLPKPFEEMTLADMLGYMLRSEAALRLWLENGGARLKRAINPEWVRQALQSITWGRELAKVMIEAKNTEATMPTYDDEEAVWFIRQRTDLPEETIRAVLEADAAYMADKGLLAGDPPDIQTVGPVQ